MRLKNLENFCDELKYLPPLPLPQIIITKTKIFSSRQMWRHLSTTSYAFSPMFRKTSTLQYAFHVTNGFRQGGALSPYLFAVYLNDLSTELNKNKTGCCVGEVLLNHLMFAYDIWVFCPSVRGLHSILDVCQAYAELHGITFNYSKTVCMTFKAKSGAKTAVTPLLTLGGQNVRSVNHCKYLGIVLDTELSDDKDIQRQLPYQYCAANKLRGSFSRCLNAVKNVLFRSFCTPMYAPQLWYNFRKSCMQRLRVVCNFGCRALYNLP